MHVLTPSLSVRHGGSVSHPRTMAAWQLLSQAKNKRRRQSPVADGNMVKMVFCTCVCA